MWDKFRIWFMPTGWRPADVVEHFPILSVKDAGKQVKYQPAANTYLKIWAWLQLILTFLLMQFMIFQLTVFSKTDILVYAAFIFLSVYSYTSLMDKSRHAWIVEIVRLCFALLIIRFYNGWFTVDSFLPYGTFMLTTYFVLSALFSLAFEYFYLKPSNLQVTNV